MINNQIIHEVFFDEEQNFVLAWSPDGKWIATGGRILRIWDTNTWQVAEQLSVDGVVSSLEWSADSEHVFHNGFFGGLYLDDVPVHELVFTPEATEEP